VSRTRACCGQGAIVPEGLSQALDAFRQARGFAPQPGRPGEVRFWEAETLFRLDRYAEARDGYDRILAEDSTSPLRRMPSTDGLQ
jgi:hypothetical protein